MGNERRSTLILLKWGPYFQFNNIFFYHREGVNLLYIGTRHNDSYLVVFEFL